jgi:hypothetical protein
MSVSRGVRGCLANEKEGALLHLYFREADHEVTSNLVKRRWQLRLYIWYRPQGSIRMGKCLL